MKIFLRSDFYNHFFDPAVFYVGTTQSENGCTVCYLDSFVKEGKWVNFWGVQNIISATRTKSIKQGDIIIAKHCQGAGNPIRIKAVGIAMDSCYVDSDHLGVPVLWVLPEVSKEVPFGGMGSTIHNFLNSANLDLVSIDLIKVARGRFLKAFCSQVIDTKTRF